MLTAASAARVFGANEKVRIGLIGCGGRGRYVTGFMRESPHAEIAASADVYLPLARKTSDRAFSDFRRLLELRDIDAVVVATPDHWHAGCTVLACEAGKDVYVEKPLCHSILEGRAMVQAARKHRRTVLTGTQHRSSPHFAEVAEIVRSGRLGEVRFVRVWNYSNMTPAGIGRQPDSEPPEELDWDMYCGPAPKVPYNRSRFTSTFRWFWDYAGGTITDFGTHRFDTVHQIMGVDAPRTIAASGGRFTLKDAGEMPDLLQVTYEYPGFVLSYEACNLNAHGLGGRRAGMRYYGAKGPEDRPNGMAFYGTNGALFADRLGFEIYPEGGRIESRQMNTRDATGLHALHFIDCVRGVAKPVADVEIGHKSTAIAHLGNIAFKTGQKLRWLAAEEKFNGSAEAAALLWRTPRKPWDLVKRPV